MKTKQALEIGDVEEDGVATSDVVYFVRNRIALRLDGEEGMVVAALSRTAVDKLHQLLTPALHGENGPDSRDAS